MSNHEHFSKFSKQYFRNFFKRWHREWGRSRPFIFIHLNSQNFELTFVDELATGDLSTILENPRSLHLKMRAFRVQAGLSQQEWAKKLGVSASNVTKIERGSREPGLKIIRKFCEYVATCSAPPTIDSTSTTDSQTPKKRSLPGVDDDTAILKWLSSLRRR